MIFALEGWVFDILEHFGNLMEYLKDCEENKEITDLERDKIECAKKKLIAEIQKIRNHIQKNKNI